MAAMNTNIPMMGQGVNALQAIQQGTAAAGLTNQNRRTNALEQFMQTNGGAVMQGDEQALGQYAALAGPEAALNVQNTRQVMDVRTQANDRAGSAELRAMETHAATLSKNERDAMAEEVRLGLVSAVPFVQGGDVAGFNARIAEFGLPPVADVAGMQNLMAQGKDTYDAMIRAQDLTGGGDQFRIASPEEAAQYGAKAGQFGGDGRFYPVKPDGGMQLTVGADGSVRFTENATGDDSPDAPATPSAMIASIDGILGDPALDQSTGALALLQAVPGTAMYRFGQRTKQLEGQAFLRAFDNLKGGGQITEIEGTKATQAYGRLSTWQSPEDYRTALTEMRDLLVLAQTRPQGWAETQSAGGPGSKDISNMTLDQVMTFDLNTATAEEMDAWALRFEEVNQ